MKTKIIYLVLAIMLSAVCFVSGVVHSMKYECHVEGDEVSLVEDKILLDTLTLNKENFIYACDAFDIKFPEIVYAQARLESGNFSSRIYREHNNMLGLYDSRNKTYYKFDNWIRCLEGYKNMVQYKYTDGDYFQFLTDLPYAADKAYTHKLKTIIGY